MRLLLAVVLTWAEISTLSIIQAVPAAPVQIGNTRQLFLDDFVIGSMENLTRVLHHPQRYSGNPILTGTQSWEKWVIGVNGRSVLYDQESQEFRMWYGGYLIDEAYPRGILFKVCYAVSADGIHWTRPNLGQVDWEGSRRNNILRWGQKWMRRPNVMKDPGDPDPERRFKMTYVDILEGKTAITKGYSRDGIRWRLNGDEKPWFRGPHSANLLGWDPSLRQYVLYVRMPGFPNSVGRTTSRDFITWSEPRRVLAPELEEGKHFKGLAAFLYEDLYLGWLWIFYGRRSADAELVLSRDGIRWHRISPTGFLLLSRRPWVLGRPEDLARSTGSSQGSHLDLLFRREPDPSHTGDAETGKLGLGRKRPATAASYRVGHAPAGWVRLPAGGKSGRQIDHQNGDPPWRLSVRECRRRR